MLIIQKDYLARVLLKYLKDDSVKAFTLRLPLCIVLSAKRQMIEQDRFFSPYMKILKKSWRVSRNTSWFFIRRVRMESWCLFWARIATWNEIKYEKCVLSQNFFTSCSAVSELLSRMRLSKNLRISFLFSEAEIEESMGVWPNLSLDFRAVCM